MNSGLYSFFFFHKNKTIRYSQPIESPNNYRVNQMKSIQTEGLKLFERKNKDYGDAFARYGTVGVLIRMGDKISRLQSITKSGITLVDDEQIRDTLIDLHNYSAMTIMLLDEGKEMNIEEETYTDEHYYNNYNNNNYNNNNYNNNYNPLFIGLVLSYGFIIFTKL
jgi:hypothetical protein